MHRNVRHVHRKNNFSHAGNCLMISQKLIIITRHYLVARNKEVFRPIFRREYDLDYGSPYLSTKHNIRISTESHYLLHVNMYNAFQNKF